VLCLIVTIVVLVTGGVARSKSKTSHFMVSMQTEVLQLANARDFLTKVHCTMSILLENVLSVRGYGLRAYKPRQGRNAATVV
jgi:hypothetical protein